MPPVYGKYRESVTKTKNGCGKTPASVFFVGTERVMINFRSDRKETYFDKERTSCAGIKPVWQPGTRHRRSLLMDDIRN